jgi:flagellar FliL protein
MKGIIGILKKIAIPLVAFLVTVLLGIGLLLSGLLPFSLQLSTASQQTTDNTPLPEPTPLPYFQPPTELFELSGGIYYETGQRIVNLADPGGYRFLRISVVLEFLPDSPDYYTLTGEKLLAAQEAFKAEVDKQRPIIDNVLTDVLTSKQFDEVFSVEGKNKLREEIREQLNQNLRNRYVQRVLFTDFVIQ